MEEKRGILVNHANLQVGDTTLLGKHSNVNFSFRALISPSVKKFATNPIKEHRLRIPLSISRSFLFIHLLN